MLPLWIIDITPKSDRRDAFMRLVGQIDHVFIRKDDETVFSNTVEEFITEEETETLNNNIAINETTESDDTVETEIADEDHIRERLKKEEERKAARNAKITGNYWYYSSYELEDFFSKEDIDKVTSVSTNETDVTADDEGIISIANSVYKFQEKIIRDAKDFIMELRASNAKPYQPINIIVLGDASEELTQMIYASIAIIIQKEKGRFLVGHIHQGMRIFGALYIPCNTNASTVSERVKILRLLREIEVQHNITAIRGYDNMMLYQDVQNRVECSYTRLNPQEQAEYLVQCIVHMFLACDINHPLLSGTGTDDTFYFSMGASSIYFDMTVEDQNDANMVADNIVNSFKADGDHEKSDIDVKLFDENQFTADHFVGHFHVEKIDLAKTFEKESPSPHPIADFTNRNLKRFYYQYYLRYFPADLLREVMLKIDDSTKKQLEEISRHSNSELQGAEKLLPHTLKKILSKVNPNGGALAFVEEKFHGMQEFMSREKNQIQRSLESCYWQKIIAENNTSFEEYHDVYRTDIETKNNGSGCNTLKKEKLSQLKEMLSKEKTLMSTFVRTFLLGIILVLSLLPIVEFISYTVIDLGDVRHNAFYWGIAFFMIPVLIQFIHLFFYIRKKTNLINTLKVYYTHDAYARIANRIESEATAYYNKLIDLTEAYLQRCKRIRNEIRIKTPAPQLNLLFPQSKFNQPLNEGVFNGVSLIPSSEVERCLIRVNGRPEIVNKLTTEDYFILINHFKDEFSSLFDGVSLIDKHARRFDETIGDYVFVSQEETKQECEELWKKTKEEFFVQLFKGIKKEMLPRACPTIGDKLIQYKKKMNSFDLLEEMVAYAATNGEFSSEKNTEYADIKINREIEDLLTQYLPLYTTQVQCSKYEELFKKYIFVTRWKTFKSLALNRILPKEDFDQETRELCIYTDETKAKQKKAKKNTLNQNIDLDLDTLDLELKEMKYKRYLSSLILWSVSPDDNSNEWLNLFDVNFFSTAYSERNKLREVLNQND